MPWLKLNNPHSFILEMRYANLNIRELLTDGRGRLAGSGVPNAQRNAEWIMISVLGCGILDLYINSDRILSSSEVERYQTFIKRRADREPLQYILGETAFMSLPFKMRPGVFIPRPDSEVLVERIEKKLEKLSGVVRCLDLCCGAGVIAVSLAARLPHAEVTGIDSSEEAVALSEINASLNGAASRVRIYQADARDYLITNNELFDAIVCNPPYIPTGDIPELPPEVRDHEPMEALDGGSDGLTFYEDIIPLLSSRIKPGGCSAFEIDPSLREAVEDFFEAAGFIEVETYKDYGRNDRAVFGRCPPTGA